MVKSTLIFILFLSPLCLLSQETNSKLKWCDEMIEGDHSWSGIPLSPPLSDYFKSIEHPWQIVGPQTKPIENNPGGKAIPKYATGRGNGTGRINRIYFNPTNSNHVFACSPTGGLFHSKDNGLNWRVAGTDQLQISGVAAVTVNPLDENQWYIGTGDSDDRFMFSDGIWRTPDGGATWENINGKGNRGFPVSEVGREYTYITDIAAHPCDFNRVFVASNKGLFMTENGLDKANKVKWKKIASTFFFDIEIIPWEEEVVVASGELLMISKDCGVHWSEITLPRLTDENKFPFLRINVELTNADPHVLYCGISRSDSFTGRSFGEASFQKYDIKTDEWTFVRSLKTGMNNLIHTRARAFTVSPLDRNYLLTANVQPIYFSSNGGVSFDKIIKGQMHDDVHHIIFAPGGESVWASHDGGVSISFDQGETWESRDNGIGVANVFGLAVAQTKAEQVLFGAYDTGGNLLKDSTWFHVTWGDGFETIIHPQDPDIMFSSKQNGMINRTIDGGVDFDDPVSPGITKTEWHSWIKMHPVYNHTIYCAGTKLVRSTNLGEDWESILDVSQFGESALNVYKFWMSENHPDVMYAYVLFKKKTEPRIYITENLNEENVDKIKWEEVAKIPQKGWIKDLVVDPLDPKKFYMSYGAYLPEKKVVYFNGTNYLDITDNLGFSIVGAMTMDIKNGNRLYIGTNYGVFTRLKGEKNWTLLEGLPGTFIKSIQFNHATDKIYVGTHGRGVWKAPIYNP